MCVMKKRNQAGTLLPRRYVLGMTTYQVVSVINWWLCHRAKPLKSVINPNCHSSVRLNLKIAYWDFVSTLQLENVWFIKFKVNQIFPKMFEKMKKKTIFVTLVLYRG